MASSGAATAALQSDASSRMEGWLYLIRFNRIGLQFSRKRYFVLDGNLLRSFKSVPVSNNQVRVYAFFFWNFICRILLEAQTNFCFFFMPLK